MRKRGQAQQVLIVALLLATLGFYLSFVNRTIQYDEAYTLRHFAVHPGIALLSYTEPNNHMLHSLLVWASTTLGGMSLLAVRFPALMMALLAVAMIYRVGRRLGGWQAGLLAAVFLATNSVFADYAVNARGYTLAIFLTLVLVDQVFLSKPKRTRRSRYGLMLTCFALILTLPTMALLIAGALLWVVWQARRIRQYWLAVPPLVIGSIGGSLFYLPAVLTGMLARSAGRFGYRELSPLLAEWLTMVFGTPLVGVVLAACCVIGFVFILMRHRRNVLAQLVVSVAGMAMIAVLGQYLLTGQVFYGRNYFYLLPLVCLVASVGVTAISRQAAVALAVVICVVAVVPLRATLGAETVFDQLLARFDMLLTDSDMLVIGNFADEPMFYTLQQRGEWERLLLDANKQRLLVITQEGDNMTTLLDVYGLEPYVERCEQSDEARWLPFVVYECAFSATPA